MTNRNDDLPRFADIRDGIPTPDYRPLRRVFWLAVFIGIVGLWVAL